MFKDYSIVCIENFEFKSLKKIIEIETQKKKDCTLSKIIVFLDFNKFQNIQQLIDEIKSYLKFYINRNVLLIFIPQTPIFSQFMSIELEFLHSKFPISLNTYLTKDKHLIVQEVDTSIYQETTSILNLISHFENAHRSIQEILQFSIDFHKKNGLEIIRLWNFIENITGGNQNEEGLIEQNYQTFNNARYCSYSKYDLKSFPASTGIGMDFMKLLTICTSVPEKYNGKIYYLSNKLQKEAYKYDENVLVGNISRNYPPLFSRGLIFETVENYQIYVSGTSSIIGQVSINSNDLISATNSTINNIMEVCNASEISTVLKRNILPEQINYNFARIYIKNKFAHDAIFVKEIIDNKFPNISASYVIADICREELAIEIEVYAEIEKNND